LPKACRLPDYKQTGASYPDGLCFIDGKPCPKRLNYVSCRNCKKGIEYVKKHPPINEEEEEYGTRQNKRKNRSRRNVKT